MRTRLLVAEEARGAAERGFVECWGACVPPLGPSHDAPGGLYLGRWQHSEGVLAEAPGRGRGGRQGEGHGRVVFLSQAEAVDEGSGQGQRRKVERQSEVIEQRSTERQRQGQGQRQGKAQLGEQWRGWRQQLQAVKVGGIELEQFGLCLAGVVLAMPGELSGAVKAALKEWESRISQRPRHK